MKNEQIAVVVRQVQKDKQANFGLLYKEIWKPVYYYCHKHLGNEQDVNDAMQTIFLKVYNTFDTLENPFAFNSFLRTIMTRTCADVHRANYKVEVDELDEYDDSLEEDNKDFLPDEAFEREDVRRAIAEMIQALPAKQREAILLFYYEDLSVKEIAEVTESNVPAVKNSLVRARQSLRERAEELIKKGAMSKVMVIIPLPILTRILLWEAEQVATPEVGEAIWENICNELGLPTTTTPSATTSTVGINVAIGVCAAAVLVTGVWFGVYLNNNIINPSMTYYHEEATEVTEYIIDFEPLILAITNRAEFDEFIQTYEFSRLGGERDEGGNVKSLFFLEYRNQFIYVGFIEESQQFRVVFEITDNNSERMTSEAIPAWFAGRN